MQSHRKLPIAEKRRNKEVKYLTWNCIRLKFGKEASMPNSVKSLGCINCHSSSSSKPVKSPSNSIRHNCQKIAPDLLVVRQSDLFSSHQIFNEYRSPHKSKVQCRFLPCSILIVITQCDESDRITFDNENIVRQTFLNSYEYYHHYHLIIKSKI